MKFLKNLVKIARIFSTFSEIFMTLCLFTSFALFLLIFIEILHFIFDNFNNLSIFFQRCWIIFLKILKFQHFWRFLYFFDCFYHVFNDWYEYLNNFKYNFNIFNVISYSITILNRFKGAKSDFKNVGFVITSLLWENPMEMAYFQSVDRFRKVIYNQFW